MKSVSRDFYIVVLITENKRNVPRSKSNYRRIHKGAIARCDCCYRALLFEGASGSALAVSDWCSSLCSFSVSLPDFLRIIVWSGLEGTFEGHLAQPLQAAGTSAARSSCSATSKLDMNISRDGASTFGQAVPVSHHPQWESLSRQGKDRRKGKKGLTSPPASLFGKKIQDKPYPSYTSLTPLLS